MSSGAQGISLLTFKCSGACNILYFKGKKKIIQCTSIVTDPASTSVQNCQYYFVGRRDFPHSETDYISHSKQSLQKKNLFDIQSAKMSHSIYSQSCDLCKYQRCFQPNYCAFDISKRQAPTDNSSKMVNQYITMDILPFIFCLYTTQDPCI